ncbi:hypothetical protein [Rubripirellula reticaptiva]|uniref:Uncharacterized protein n=1 Tax=Rubripirellula reticaptiva TaxID=2528013 RepID=A0A5C6F6S8_9BACT|nr:hypothetical protein [Rubripirellula reticaptiva]TWU56280.1 hypothetical protein Poly59_25840 [Rubripirellula reticaptiva]
MPNFLVEPRVKGNPIMQQMAEVIIAAFAEAPPSIPPSKVHRLQQATRKRSNAMDEGRSAKIQLPADAVFRGHHTVLLEMKIRAFFKELQLKKPAIDKLWELFKTGIVEQRELVKLRDTRDVKIGRDHPEHTNHSFLDIASVLETNQSLFAHNKMALWSGGYAVSEFAQSLGYTCLESSLIGAAMERGKWYRSDETLKALWNYLSYEFVCQAAQSDIHMFVRNFDKNSVMFRIELPKLLKLQQQHGMRFRILWHVLVGDTENAHELKSLDRAGKLVSGEAAKYLFFDSPESAEDAMRAYYDGLSDKEAKRIKNRELVLSSSVQPKYRRVA